MLGTSGLSATAHSLIAEYEGIQELYNEAILCFSTLFSSTQWTVCFSAPVSAAIRSNPPTLTASGKETEICHPGNRNTGCRNYSKKGVHQCNYLQPRERGWGEWSPFKLAQKLLGTALRLSRLHHEAEILTGRQAGRRGCGRQRD